MDKLGRTPTQEVISAFLLSYRSTPHAVTQFAPSELFLQRQLKTRLNLMRPDVTQLVSDKQTSQKWYHDARRKDRTWAVGERVLVRDYRRDANKWSRGQITKVLGTHTYLVMLEEGLVVKRHTDQIQNHGL